MSQTEARSPSQTAKTGPNSIDEVTLTLADIEEGLGALPRARTARYVTWIGACAVISMVAYRWFEGRDRTSLVVIAVVLLGIILSNRNPARKIARRVYASLPEDAKALRISVDETGFRVVSSGNEAALPWDQVRRCVETRNVFVVFLSKHDAQILPKRAFGDADIRAIRQWSASKVRKHEDPWLTPDLRRRMMIWLVVFAIVWLAWTMYVRR